MKLTPEKELFNLKKKKIKIEHKIQRLEGIIKKKKIDSPLKIPSGVTSKVILRKKIENEKQR